METVLQDSLEKMLNSFFIQYNTPQFIVDDPVQFVHRYTNPLDQEIVGFIAASFAYGRRDKILENVDKILILMEETPSRFLESFDVNKDYKLFLPIVYRYNKGVDVACLLYYLQKLIRQYSSLYTAFKAGDSLKEVDIQGGLQNFMAVLTVPPLPAFMQKKSLTGLNWLLPDPCRGSACKRLNLFLRWMVRRDSVDIGLWEDICPSRLIIPLDTHVARVARQLGLITRKSDDWITAKELTERLKCYDPHDPVKYDFALFGYGVTTP